MVYAKDFSGKNDTEIIANAIKNREDDGVVVISSFGDKKEWLLDSAVILPSNTTIIIDNCKIKLSDLCRDNFFRTEDCKTLSNKLENIHIIGKGNAWLEGAEHPRATGDFAKILANPAPHTTEDLIKYAPWISDEHKQSGNITYDDANSHTYGTDAGKEGVSQYGTSENFGILFKNVDRFSIENISLKDTHCFGIVIYAGRNGRITNIHFENHLYKMIDGMKQTIENQDGIDILQGSHDIIVSDITGITGDDVVALGCNNSKNTAKAQLTNQIGGNIENDDESFSPDVRNIIVRNIKATSVYAWIIRLLPVEASIYNIIIDNIIDTSPKSGSAGAVVVGFSDEYGKNLPESNRDICISNVISNGYQGAVVIHGYMANSVISNVICKNKNVKPIVITRENGIKNVQMSNII